MMVRVGLVRKMGLIQQSHDLIHTKRKNTEHQVCINFLMSAHPQVARPKVVLETAIHPFNHSSHFIALIRRMIKPALLDALRSFARDSFKSLFLLGFVSIMLTRPFFLE